MTTVEKFIDSRNSRIDILLSKLDSNWDKFTDLMINNTLCKIPKVNQIPNKRYYQFKIKLPIGYETTSKYRIRLKDKIFDLYKTNYNYHFISVPVNQNPSMELFTKFSTTIQYSFIYYITHTLLKELKSQGLNINISDYLYTGLLQQFHSNADTDMEVILTPFSVKNKDYKTNKLYISLFN